MLGGVRNEIALRAQKNKKSQKREEKHMLIYGRIVDGFDDYLMRGSVAIQMFPRQVIQLLRVPSLFCPRETFSSQIGDKIHISKGIIRWSLMEARRSAVLFWSFTGSLIHD